MLLVLVVSLLFLSYSVGAVHKGDDYYEKAEDLNDEGRSYFFLKFFFFNASH